jgi:hypothetical protein
VKKPPRDPYLSTGQSANSRASARASGPRLSLDSAQELAIAALVYLAADPDKVRSFAEASGLSAENLRAAAESPDFLAAVLDYVLSDESLLLTFAANCGIEPADIPRARAVLSPRADE